MSPASLTNVASPLVCSSLTALEAPSVAARIQMRVQKGHFRWRSSRLCRTYRRSCSVRWCTGSQRGACLVLRKTGQRCHLGHRSRATSTRGAVFERADSRPPLFLPLKSMSSSAARRDPPRHSQQLGSRSNLRHFLHDGRTAQGWAACRSGRARAQQ